MVNKTKIGIIGGSGYTGEELTKLISSHPNALLRAVSSRELIGEDLKSIYSDIDNLSEIQFCSPEYSNFSDCDIVFFATPHGCSMYLVREFLEKNIKVIDLSADFRIKDPNIWEKWYEIPHASPDLLEQAEYGLVEINSRSIASSQLVSVPGCYPTAILLGLMPALEISEQINNIICDAKSGLSGAGRSSVDGFLLNEMESNFKAYGIERHRHTPEIKQLIDLKASQLEFNFIPHLIPIMRGIYVTLYITFEDSCPELRKVYSDFYQDFQNINVLEKGEISEISSVLNTNNCDISLHKSTISNQIIVISAIDNLIKGAAGQAIQCMNLMSSFDIDLGLS